MDDFPSGARIYIDSNIFIYFIESNPTFREKTREVFERISKAGATPVTNEIAIAECLHQPAATGNLRAIDAYERLFASKDVLVTRLDGGLARRAAMAGGQLSLKLMDAIHYLAALEAGCAYFVTADAAFKSGPLMQVLRVV